MPFVKCNDINVYYEIHGDGPPLLFLNGLGSDITKKMPFIDIAKKHFMVIAPDNRGAGRSDKPKALYTIDEMANDTMAVVAGLGIKRLAVAGFSMGGFIAQTIAIANPELVERLFLIATKPAWNKPFSISEKAGRILHCTEPTPAVLNDVYELTYGKAYRARFPIEGYLKDRMSDKYPQPLHGYLGQVNACETFDVCDRFGKIKAPTLIIAGNADELIPPENARWMNERIKGSRLVTYDGMGHMLMDECPERVLKEILIQIPFLCP